VKFGLVVNPYAGMGGSVGLKGTDGPAYEEAVAKGAVPKAKERAKLALMSAGDLSSVEFCAPEGAMGGNVLDELGIHYTVVITPPDHTEGRDTTEAVRLFCSLGCDLVLFCGGDGTARDVLDGADGDTKCLGIPAGVKMHSGVFANTPADAGALIREFVHGLRSFKKAEVMDIDEDMFREGVLAARLIGYLDVLDEASLVQPPKGTTDMTDDLGEKEEVAAYIADIIEKDVVYVLGPGTTVEAIAKELGLEKTLLGVDVLLNGAIVAADAAEKDVLREIEGRKARIVVTPIGRQGFIFGRGNQQISPAVITSVGIENIIVVATPGKLRGLRSLRSDTGDALLDEELRRHYRMIVGFGREKMMKLE